MVPNQSHTAAVQESFRDVAEAAFPRLSLQRSKKRLGPWRMAYNVPLEFAPIDPSSSCPSVTMPSAYRRALVVAAFAFVPCLPLVAQGGATVTGVHANEAFCQTMIKQVDLGAAYVKSDPGLIPDRTKQAKYFADQKALNATLVKTAPASLAGEIARFTTAANAYYDVQLAGRAGDREAMRSAARGMRSPEHLAASKHMSEYCGAKMPGSR
jgi:hypothetical protein